MNDHSLSQKAQTRTAIWISVLQKTCNYLVVCEKAYLRLQKLKGIECDSYSVGGIEYTYFEPFVIEKGLSEAALIGLRSVLFVSGYGGEGISGNNNPEISSLRKEMFDFAYSKLGYKDVSEFEEYINHLITVCDKQIAHYDGGYADYKEYFEGQDNDGGKATGKTPFMISLKMPSATFTYDQVLKLKTTAFVLLESLNEVLAKHKD